MSGYKISEHFAQRLKATVLKVDRMPEATGGSGKIPVRFDEVVRRGGGGGSTVSLGTYSTDGTQWEKGQVKPIHAYTLEQTSSGGYSITPDYSDGLPVVVDVLNLFVTIPPNYDTVRYCAYVEVGGVNLLIGAEC